MKNVLKPSADSYPAYFEKYINLVKSENVFEEFYSEHMETVDLLTSVDEETLQFRYEEGKWNIREVLQHMIDCERIFNYRALRISRGDQSPQPGFDQQQFVLESNASKRDINDMVRELSVVRAATVELFKSFTDEMLDRKGISNNHEISVRAILFITLGHEIHHRNVIDEKYLPR